SLGEVFAVDRKTMQRWGQALHCGDPVHLVRVLEGRSTRRKLTQEIKAYARMRWPQIAKQSRYGCSQRLCQEIKAVFGVQLSTETLRPLVRELKAAAKAPAAGQPFAGANASQAQRTSGEASEALGPPRPRLPLGRRLAA